MSAAERPIGVAVLGLGNVGREVVRIIEQSAPDLAARIGAPLVLRGVAVRTPTGDRGVPASLLTDNVDAILDARDPLILSAMFDESTVRLLTAYMSALTDDRARSLERLVPRSVPSGLSVDR